MSTPAAPTCSDWFRKGREVSCTLDTLADSSYVFPLSGDSDDQQARNACDEAYTLTGVACKDDPACTPVLTCVGDSCLDEDALSAAEKTDSPCPATYPVLRAATCGEIPLSLRVPLDLAPAACQQAPHGCVKKNHEGGPACYHTDQFRGADYHARPGKVWLCGREKDASTCTYTGTLAAPVLRIGGSDDTTLTGVWSPSAGPVCDRCDVPHVARRACTAVPPCHLHTNATSCAAPCAWTSDGGGACRVPASLCTHSGCCFDEDSSDAPCYLALDETLVQRREESQQDTRKCSLFTQREPLTLDDPCLGVVSREDDAGSCTLMTCSRGVTSGAAKVTLQKPFAASALWRKPAPTTSSLCQQCHTNEWLPAMGRDVVIPSGACESVSTTSINLPTNTTRACNHDPCEEGTYCLDRDSGHYQNCCLNGAWQNKFCPPALLTQYRQQTNVACNNGNRLDGGAEQKTLLGCQVACNDSHDCTYFTWNGNDGQKTCQLYQQHHTCPNPTVSEGDDLYTQLPRPWMRAGFDALQQSHRLNVLQHNVYSQAEIQKALESVGCTNSDFRDLPTTFQNVQVADWSKHCSTTTQKVLWPCRPHVVGQYELLKLDSSGASGDAATCYSANDDVVPCPDQAGGIGQVPQHGFVTLGMYDDVLLCQQAVSIAASSDQSHTYYGYIWANWEDNNIESESKMCKGIIKPLVHGKVDDVEVEPLPDAYTMGVVHNLTSVLDQWRSSSEVDMYRDMLSICRSCEVTNCDEQSTQSACEAAMCQWNPSLDANASSGGTCTSMCAGPSVHSGNVEVPGSFNHAICCGADHDCAKLRCVDSAVQLDDSNYCPSGKDHAQARFGGHRLQSTAHCAGVALPHSLAVSQANSSDACTLACEGIADAACCQWDGTTCTAFGTPQTRTYELVDQTQYDYHLYDNLYQQHLFRDLSQSDASSYDEMMRRGEQPAVFSRAQLQCTPAHPHYDMDALTHVVDTCTEFDADGAQLRTTSASSGVPMVCGGACPPVTLLDIEKVQLQMPPRAIGEVRDHAVVSRPEDTHTYHTASDAQRACRKLGYDGLCAASTASGLGTDKTWGWTSDQTISGTNVPSFLQDPALSKIPFTQCASRSSNAMECLSTSNPCSTHDTSATCASAKGECVWYEHSLEEKASMDRIAKAAAMCPVDFPELVQNDEGQWMCHDPLRMPCLGYDVAVRGDNTVSPRAPAPGTPEADYLACSTIHGTTQGFCKVDGQIYDGDFGGAKDPRAPDACRGTADEPSSQWAFHVDDCDLAQTCSKALDFRNLNVSCTTPYAWGMCIRKYQQETGEHTNCPGTSACVPKNPDDTLTTCVSTSQASECKATSGSGTCVMKSRNQCADASGAWMNEEDFWCEQASPLCGYDASSKTCRPKIEMAAVLDASDAACTLEAGQPLLKAEQSAKLLTYEGALRHIGGDGSTGYDFDSRDKAESACHTLGYAGLCRPEQLESNPNVTLATHPENSSAAYDGQCKTGWMSSGTSDLTSIVEGSVPYTISSDVFTFTESDRKGDTIFLVQKNQKTYQIPQDDKQIACEAVNARVCSYDEMQLATDTASAEWCSCSWVSNNDKAYYPMQDATPPNTGDGCGGPDKGVRTCTIGSTGLADVCCYRTSKEHRIIGALTPQVDDFGHILTGNCTGNDDPVLQSESTPLSECAAKCAASKTCNYVVKDKSDDDTKEGLCHYKTQCPRDSLQPDANVQSYRLTCPTTATTKDECTKGAGSSSVECLWQEGKDGNPGTCTESPGYYVNNYRCTSHEADACPCHLHGDDLQCSSAGCGGPGWHYAGLSCSACSLRDVVSCEGSPGCTWDDASGTCTKSAEQNEQACAGAWCCNPTPAMGCRALGEEFVPGNHQKLLVDELELNTPLQFTVYPNATLATVTPPYGTSSDHTYCPGGLRMFDGADNTGTTPAERARNCAERCLAKHEPIEEDKTWDGFVATGFNVKEEGELQGRCYCLADCVAPESDPTYNAYKLQASDEITGVTPSECEAKCLEVNSQSERSCMGVEYILRDTDGNSGDDSAYPKCRLFPDLVYSDIVHLTNSQSDWDQTQGSSQVHLRGGEGWQRTGTGPHDWAGPTTYPSCRLDKRTSDNPSKPTTWNCAYDSPQAKAIYAAGFKHACCANDGLCKGSDFGCDQLNRDWNGPVYTCAEDACYSDPKQGGTGGICRKLSEPHAIRAYASKALVLHPDNTNNTPDASNSCHVPSIYRTFDHIVAPDGGNWVTSDVVPTPCREPPAAGTPRVVGPLVMTVPPDDAAHLTHPVYVHYTQHDTAACLGTGGAATPQPEAASPDSCQRLCAMDATCTAFDWNTTPDAEKPSCYTHSGSDVQPSTDGDQTHTTCWVRRANAAPGHLRTANACLRACRDRQQQGWCGWTQSTETCVFDESGDGPVIQYAGYCAVDKPNENRKLATPVGQLTLQQCRQACATEKVGGDDCNRYAWSDDPYCIMEGTEDACTASTGKDGKNNCSWDAAQNKCYRDFDREPVNELSSGMCYLYSGSWEEQKPDDVEAAKQGFVCHHGNEPATTTTPPANAFGVNSVIARKYFGAADAAAHGSSQIALAYFHPVDDADDVSGTCQDAWHCAWDVTHGCRYEHPVGAFCCMEDGKQPPLCDLSDDKLSCSQSSANIPTKQYVLPDNPLFNTKREQLEMLWKDTSCLNKTLGTDFKNELMNMEDDAQVHEELKQTCMAVQQQFGTCLPQNQVHMAECFAYSDEGDCNDNIHCQWRAAKVAGADNSKRVKRCCGVNDDCAKPLQDRSDPCPYTTSKGAYQHSGKSGDACLPMQCTGSGTTQCALFVDQDNCEAVTGCTWERDSSRTGCAYTGPGSQSTGANWLSSQDAALPVCPLANVDCDLSTMSRYASSIEACSRLCDMTNNCAAILHTDNTCLGLTTQQMQDLQVDTQISAVPELQVMRLFARSSFAREHCAETCGPPGGIPHGDDRDTYTTLAACEEKCLPNSTCMGCFESDHGTSSTPLFVQGLEKDWDSPGEAAEGRLIMAPTACYYAAGACRPSRSGSTDVCARATMVSSAGGSKQCYPANSDNELQQFTAYHRKIASPPAVGLLETSIRGWALQPNMDCIPTTPELLRVPRASVEELRTLCASMADCTGFNSNGVLFEGKMGQCTTFGSPGTQLVLKEGLGTCGVRDNASDALRDGEAVMSNKCQVGSGVCLSSGDNPTETQREACGFHTTRLACINDTETNCRWLPPCCTVTMSEGHALQSSCQGIASCQAGSVAEIEFQEVQRDCSQGDLVSEVCIAKDTSNEVAMVQCAQVVRGKTASDQRVLCETKMDDASQNALCLWIGEQGYASTTPAMETPDGRACFNMKTQTKAANANQTFCTLEQYQKSNDSTRQCANFDNGTHECPSGFYAAVNPQLEVIDPSCELHNQSELNTEDRQAACCPFESPCCMIQNGILPLATTCSTACLWDTHTSTCSSRQQYPTNKKCLPKACKPGQYYTGKGNTGCANLSIPENASLPGGYSPRYLQYVTHRANVEGTSDFIFENLGTSNTSTNIEIGEGVQISYSPCKSGNVAVMGPRKWCMHKNTFEPVDPLCWLHKDSGSCNNDSDCSWHIPPGEGEEPFCDSKKCYGKATCCWNSKQCNEGSNARDDPCWSPMFMNDFLCCPGDTTSADYNPYFIGTTHPAEDGASSACTKMCSNSQFLRSPDTATTNRRCENASSATESTRLAAGEILVQNALKCEDFTTQLTCEHPTWGTGVIDDDTSVCAWDSQRRQCSSAGSTGDQFVSPEMWCGLAPDASSYSQATCHASRECETQAETDCKKTDACEWIAEDQICKGKHDVLQFCGGGNRTGWNHALQQCTMCPPDPRCAQQKTEAGCNSIYPEERHLSNSARNENVCVFTNGQCRPKERYFNHKPTYNDSLSLPLSNAAQNAVHNFQFSSQQSSGGDKDYPMECRNVRTCPEGFLTAVAETATSNRVCENLADLLHVAGPAGAAAIIKNVYVTGVELNDAHEVLGLIKGQVTHTCPEGHIMARRPLVCADFQTEEDCGDGQSYSNRPILSSRHLDICKWTPNDADDPSKGGTCSPSQFQDTFLTSEGVAGSAPHGLFVEDAMCAPLKDYCIYKATDETKVNMATIADEAGSKAGQSSQFRLLNTRTNRAYETKFDSHNSGSPPTYRSAYAIRQCLHHDDKRFIGPALGSSSTPASSTTPMNLMDHYRCNGVPTEGQDDCVGMTLEDQQNILSKFSNVQESDHFLSPVSFGNGACVREHKPSKTSTSAKWTIQTSGASQGQWKLVGTADETPCMHQAPQDACRYRFQTAEQAENACRYFNGLRKETDNTSLSRKCSGDHCGSIVMNPNESPKINGNPAPNLWTQHLPDDIPECKGIVKLSNTTQDTKCLSYGQLSLTDESNAKHHFVGHNDQYKTPAIAPTDTTDAIACSSEETKDTIDGAHQCGWMIYHEAAMAADHHYHPFRNNMMPMGQSFASLNDMANDATGSVYLVTSDATANQPSPAATWPNGVFNMSCSASDVLGGDDVAATSNPSWTNWNKCAESNADDATSSKTMGAYAAFWRIGGAYSNDDLPIGYKAQSKQGGDSKNQGGYVPWDDLKNNQCEWKNDSCEPVVGKGSSHYCYQIRDEALCSNALCKPVVGKSDAQGTYSWKCDDHCSNLWLHRAQANGVGAGVGRGVGEVGSTTFGTTHAQGSNSDDYGPTNDNAFIPGRGYVNRASIIMANDQYHGGALNNWNVCHGIATDSESMNYLSEPGDDKALMHGSTEPTTLSDNVQDLNNDDYIQELAQCSDFQEYTA